MTFRNVLATFVVVAVLALGGTAMTACERQKGPAEKAGEKIDKAADKVSDKINPKGPVEKAGRAIDRAAGD